MKDYDNITNIVFDLGGVIFRLDKELAITRFKEIGVTNVESYLDDYEQKGIFGELESGAISAKQYCEQLSQIAQKELSMDQLEYAWTGYVAELFQRNFDALVKLRNCGYRLALLSNTNPFMMHWALSERFDGNGHGLKYYFDHLYLSFEMGMMKPNEEIFKTMLRGEKVPAQQVLFIDDSSRNCAAAASLGIKTINPPNGSDWTIRLFELLGLQSD